MRFISAANRLKFVVRPAWHEIVGPNKIPRSGLRARFLNHVFDSDRAQTQLGWTDDERREVERALLKSPLFNAANGFYLEELQQGEQADAAREVLASVGVPAHRQGTRCIAFFRGEDGGPEQCPNEPVPGEDLCAQHLEVESKANAEDEEPEIEIPQVPVTETVDEPREPVTASERRAQALAEAVPPPAPPDPETAMTPEQLADVAAAGGEDD